jgi:hypothetical protein
MERIVSRKQQITQGANIRDGKKEFFGVKISIFPLKTLQNVKKSAFFLQKSC